MSFTIIEIVKENNDRIEQCRVLGIYTEQKEADEKYQTLKKLVGNKIILVPNISMVDIPSLSIRQYVSSMDIP